MRGCVELLRNDPLVAESFRLANRAMLDQMSQADRVAGRDREPDDYRWRPFQLAFLLTVMVSAVREDDPFRDVLDLIWFPTGGGKTEAYLGLIAFLIAWRRQKFSDSGTGTTAFMRYTLRLLARQQFERAARMVCALELIRRRNPERLGVSSIDIGIWVGSAITPNRYEQARELVEAIRAGRPGAQYELLMERCPWCGTAFDAANGYVATDAAFHFRCTDRECDFGADPRPLPCNVVDDALYDRPPSLLVATIDKFARVAWEERTGAFFGAGTGARPPELVIQDELHLITGPLGSVAGLYEAGLDTLLVRRGVRPKYVASTATIRMAREQVKGLYARELAVFPPPGLSHDDTYFARTDRERPGRLYVGYLAPMLDQQHCFAPLAAALLAAPRALFDADEERDALLDAWWTQVAYHGSLKGVGNSHNAFVTDVRDFGRRLAHELREAGEDGLSGETDGSGEEFTGALERFRNTRLAQLTSRRTPRDNAETFQQLANPYRHEACLDAVLGDQHGVGRPGRRPSRADDRQRAAAHDRGVHSGDQPRRPRGRSGLGRGELLSPSGPQPLALRDLPSLPRVLLPLRGAEQRHPLYLPGADPRAARRPSHRRAARLRGFAKQRVGGALQQGCARGQSGARRARAALRPGCR